jgi:hypothetical protein
MGRAGAGGAVKVGEGYRMRGAGRPGQLPLSEQVVTHEREAEGAAGTASLLVRGKRTITVPTIQRSK